jgi:hypothetical protein
MTITRAFSAVATVLAIAAAAVSAAGTPFKGTTVSFSVEDSSVRRFTLSASVFCLSVSKSASEIRVFVVDEQGKLGQDGQFTLGSDKNGTKVSVSGRVKGSAAEGRFEVHYYKTFSSYDPLTHKWKLDTATCSAKATWTAQRTDTAGKKDPR